MQMKELVAGFPKQLEDALKIAASSKLTVSINSIQNVLISGLGGSGIGGTIVSELLQQNATTPINVNKDYFLHSFVNENTLAVFSSYSGNTEETLNALELAIKAKAKVVCITSGGKVLELAQQHNLDHIVIPGGMPPRACLGYSFTQLFQVLSFFGVISKGFDWKTKLEKAITLLNSESEAIHKEAKELAKVLQNKLPVIYTLGPTEGIAIRFRQQINENSKMLCWHQVIPEMNHNELVGWTIAHPEIAVLVFRTPNDYPRNVKRLEINKEVISKYSGSFTEVMAKGVSSIENAVYLIHLGDWISCYLADLQQVDAIEINVINHLKSTLAKS